MRHSIIEHTRILQELEKSIGCCAMSALLSTTNVLYRTKHSVKALIYTSYMMRVIHFQRVFCVIKSVPENVLHFIDTVYKVLNRRISELQLLENTRWIYLIKELHVPRAQSVCILKCFVTVVYSQTSSCTYFISEKVSNSSVSFISTSLSSKNI